jgi:hypothetical protein
MKHKTKDEILDVVRKFENGTISRDEWKHREHLIVAFYYIRNSKSLTEATDKMRAGLFNLLISFGVDLEKEMPYHETLTRFWIKSVDDFLKTQNGYSIVETANLLVENLGDKDLPLKYYSRELLFSDMARKHFVEPDIEEFSK